MNEQLFVFALIATVIANFFSPITAYGKFSSYCCSKCISFYSFKRFFMSDDDLASYMVAVKVWDKKQEKESVCPGAILSKTRVLTAATCLPRKFDVKKYEISIVPASIDQFEIDDKNASYSVKEFVLHKNFGFTYYGKRVVNNFWSKSHKIERQNSR